VKASDLRVNHASEGIGRRRKRRRARGDSDSALQKVNRGWAMRGLMKLLRCEKGANAIEYALVATLISIAAIAAFNNLGSKIDTMYNNVSNQL
jgi:pilus assembly protein Flp/PilA